MPVAWVQRVANYSYRYLYITDVVRERRAGLDIIQRAARRGPARFCSAPADGHIAYVYKLIIIITALL